MHLVIQIYSMCFISLLLLLASKLYWAFFGDEINYFNNLLYPLVNPIMPMIYFYHLLKNTFKLGTLNAIIKTLQLFILSAILLIILALAFLFFILIFYGMFQVVIFSPYIFIISINLIYYCFFHCIIPTKPNFIICINIINKKSRTKVARGKKVKISGFKKAIITLKKGQSIDLTTGI